MSITYIPCNLSRKTLHTVDLLVVLKLKFCSVNYTCFTGLTRIIFLNYLKLLMYYLLSKFGVKVINCFEYLFFYIDFDVTPGYATFWIRYVVVIVKHPIKLILIFVFYFNFQISIAFWNAFSILILYLYIIYIYIYIYIYLYYTDIIFMFRSEPSINISLRFTKPSFWFNVTWVISIFVDLTPLIFYHHSWWFCGT